MTPLVVAILALVLGLIVGTVTLQGLSVFAIPIVVVVLLLLGAGMFKRRSREERSMRQRRDRAKAEKVEFDERDRETLSD